MAKSAAAAKVIEPIVVSFTLERETKNTFRYAENVVGDETPAIGTLYVQKAALEALGNPESISVTINV